jgi:hypothetical protein
VAGHGIGAPGAQSDVGMGMPMGMGMGMGGMGMVGPGIDGGDPANPLTTPMNQPSPDDFPDLRYPGLPQCAPRVRINACNKRKCRQLQTCSTRSAHLLIICITADWVCIEEVRVSMVCM